MPRRLFDKFGNYLVLFFVLQVQFAIKGSNAVPGNSHGRTNRNGQGLEMNDNSGDAVNTFGNVIEESSNNGGFNGENTLNNDEMDLAIEIPNQKQDFKLIVPQPKARTANICNLDITESTETETESYHSDRLEYSMLKSTFPLRPKSLSRQSACNNSGDQTPGLDRDWVDINTEVSDSSRLARKIYSTNLFAKEDVEIEPISFDALCTFLEETAEKEMDESDLLLICKRIIKDPETFIKALKDLPLFIKNYLYNKNAIKINSILYSYLGHSGEYFKDLITVENMENGSGSSRCSSRGCGSTIESELDSPNEMMLTSPKDVPRTVSSRSPRNDHDYEHENTTIRVLDEINDAQAHVPHIRFAQNYNNFINNNIAFIPNRFGLRTVHSMQMRPFLYPLKEARTLSEEDSSSAIEEID